MSQDIKIAVLGAPGVGISSLIHRFSMDDFVSTPRSKKHRFCWGNTEENQRTEMSPGFTPAHTDDVESSFKNTFPADCTTSTGTTNDPVDESVSKQCYNSIRER